MKSENIFSFEAGYLNEENKSVFTRAKEAILFIANGANFFG